MKKIIFLLVLSITTYSANASKEATQLSSDAKLNTTINTTLYFEQFSDGIMDFICCGNFARIEKMFGDSGVYGGDCAIDSCNIYNIPLTPLEFRDQLARILTEKTNDISIVRNTHTHYTTEVFTHGTMFKFEVIYNETGRIDDFMVYVDFQGKLLNVTTNTTINLKGYHDGNTNEFRGSRGE